MKTNNLEKSNQQKAWQDLARINEQSLHPGALALTVEALTLSKIPPRAKILDVGCGTGKSLQYLLKQNYNAIGLDLSLDLLLMDYLPVIQGDMQEIPFNAQSFEALLYECTLSLATDKYKALFEAKRVLQNKGKVIICDLFVRNCTHNQEILKQELALEQSFCSQGALHQANLEEILTQLDFVIVYQQDYSKALKELAANLVWNYGSTQALFASGQNCCVNQACSNKKLDYKMIIAQKR